MRYYLAEYVDDKWTGHPTLAPGPGRKAYDVNVAGPHQILDLRGDKTGIGPCLVRTAETMPLPAIDLGDDVSAAMPTRVANQLANRLGITLSDRTNLKSVLAELLILHGTAPHDKTRWNRLKETRTGRHKITMGGEIIYDASAPRAATITETWNSSDSDSPNADHNWTEADIDISSGTNDWDIVSNEISRGDFGGNGGIRCDTDLDGDDHYAQAEFRGDTSPDNNTFVICTRWDTSAIDLYVMWYRVDGSEVFLFEYLAGSRTTISDDSTSSSLTAGDDLKIEVDGSSLEYWRNTTSLGTGTDTTITGNTRVGVAGIATAADRVVYDNFEAADLGGDERLVRRPRQIIVRGRRSRSQVFA